MTARGPSTEPESDEPPSRRTFLAAAAGAVGVALAGCSEVLEQSFEASPVVLPAEDQAALRLTETARDAHTIGRSGPSDSEIEITNHAAVYSRAVGLGGQ